MTLAQVSRYFRDPAVSGWRKLLGVAGVAYVLLPVDLVPDVIPLLGWLDDVGVVTMAMTLLSRDITRHAERASARVIDVHAEPLRRAR